MLTRIARFIALPLLLLVIWELISGWSPLSHALRQVLPPPSVVVVDAWQLLMTGELLNHISRSVLRILAGLTAAAVFGISIGLCIGLWALFEDAVDPVIEFLRPIPPPAWIPLGILWFGIGDAQNIFILFLGAFFPIVLNTIAGVRNVDRTLIWAALTLGGAHRQIVREIVIPSAFPLILTGLRIGLGIGWMALVAAELMAARAGLGFLIQSGRYAFLTERVLVGMIVIGLLGLAMDGGMRFLQRRLLPWNVNLQ